MTADPSSPQFDVVCLGESMVTFVPAHSGRLADVPAFHRHIGGAESNVACTLAREGHTARWISRVGAEGFGDHLVEAIIAAGVDTSAVQRDHHRPTGIYFRTAGERVLFHPSDTVLAGPGRSGTVTAGGGSISGGWRSGGAAAGPRPVPDGPSDTERAPGEVVYYRAGSAASAMSPAAMRRADLWSGRILHLSGITAALSADCLALMRDLTTPAPGRPLVSFDVNYRVGLWQDASEDPAVLTELARGCDLVFVGEDEARAAWGLAGPDAVRAALPEPRVLVVKQGAAGATAYRREPDGTDTVTFVPALAVDVVASVGAGDAFAAGFLSATLRGLPVTARLRHGHVMAAAALTAPGDLGVPPAREQVETLVALDDLTWGRLRLGPGWTAPEPSGRTASGRTEPERTGRRTDPGCTEPERSGRTTTTETKQ